MPHQKSIFARLAAPLLVACVLALVATPSTAATKTSAQAAAPAASGHSRLSFEGDTAQPAAGARRAHKSHKARKHHKGRKARRASFAWTGRTIPYAEAIPSKWDWSLSNAIAKWNSAGGGIQFVKASNPRKARLTIAYGNIGSAAGLASVGRSRHATVRLSSRYSGMDALDAHNRVEVLGIFTHELGHVLGFEHTSARCSLMSPVMDVDGCGVLPLSMPGFYKCRTIDGALENKFVGIYGGHARYPSAYCPIDPLPAPVSFAFTGGASSTQGEAPTPVTVSWARPSAVPAGSHVEIRSWTASTCGAVPAGADAAYASVTAGQWKDPQSDASGATCYRVQLVNRYGAGRTAVSRLMFR